MRLNLREIIEVPGGRVPFECELNTELLTFPSVKGYDEPPFAEGEVYNEAGVLNMVGQITADMQCCCDRCGAEFFSRKITDVNVTIAEEDESNDPFRFPLDGDEIDLDEILSTCFVLDMESKFLCTEDCKGICPTCGRNLNLGSCGCRKQLDPRFAVLEQLLDK